MIMPRSRAARFAAAALHHWPGVEHCKSASVLHGAVCGQLAGLTYSTRGGEWQPGVGDRHCGPRRRLRAGHGE